jgi:hypothetical protein
MISEYADPIIESFFEDNNLDEMNLQVWKDNAAFPITSCKSELYHSVRSLFLDEVDNQEVSVDDINNYIIEKVQGILDEYVSDNAHRIEHNKHDEFDWIYASSKLYMKHVQEGQVLCYFDESADEDVFNYVRDTLNHKRVVKSLKVIQSKYFRNVELIKNSDSLEKAIDKFPPNYQCVALYMLDEVSIIKVETYIVEQRNRVN